MNISTSAIYISASMRISIATEEINFRSGSKPKCRLPIQSKASYISNHANSLPRFICVEESVDVTRTPEREQIPSIDDASNDLGSRYSKIEQLDIIVAILSTMS